MNDIIQSKALSVRPISINLCFKIIWSRVSNAADKSRRSNCILEWISRDLITLSITCSTEVSVLWCKRYALWYLSISW